MRGWHAIVGSGDGTGTAIESGLLIGHHLVAAFAKVPEGGILADGCEGILLPRYHLAAIGCMTVWWRIPANVALGVTGPSPSFIVLLGVLGLRRVVAVGVVIVGGVAAHGRHVFRCRRGGGWCCVRVAMLLARDAMLARRVARWCAPAMGTLGRVGVELCGGGGRVTGVDVVALVFPVVLFGLRVTLILVVAIL